MKHYFLHLPARIRAFYTAAGFLRCVLVGGRTGDDDLFCRLLQHARLQFKGGSSDGGCGLLSKKQYAASAAIILTN